MENWCKPLKKNFPWKFLQKSLKSINFRIYLHIDIKDISVLKFWLKIHIPGEISNHLIGHTIYFYEKIRFSFSMPPLQRKQRWPKIWKFYFSWNYIVWPIKRLEISPGMWILSQNFEINILLRSICKYIQKLILFNNFCNNF